jgi:hypothetical protein
LPLRGFFERVPSVRERNTGLDGTGPIRAAVSAVTLTALTALTALPVGSVGSA